MCVGGTKCLCLIEGKKESECKRKAGRFGILRVIACTTHLSANPGKSMYLGI